VSWPSSGLTSPVSLSVLNIILSNNVGGLPDFDPIAPRVPWENLPVSYPVI
jgi:hypothetical protein